MKYLAPASLMVVALFAFTFGLTGCSSDSTEPSDSSAPAAENGDGDHGDGDGEHGDHDHGDDEHGDHDHADHDHGDHDHGDHAHSGDDGQTDMEKMKAELAKLSPEDAASALEQHMCPVSGDMLGVMGAPEKIDVNGQQVWICCDGCKDKLLENPEEYLAKLKKE